MKKYFIQFNLLLILVYNFFLFYITINHKEYFLFSFILIFILSYFHLFLLNIIINSKNSGIDEKKKYNLFLIFISYLFFFNGCINILFSIDSKINFILFVLFFLLPWFHIIHNLEKFSKEKIPFIYNHDKFSNFLYKLIIDNELNHLSRINFLILPLCLVIICTYIYSYYIFILAYSLLFITLILGARFIKDRYKNIQKNALEKIYNIANNYKPNFIIYFSGNKNSTYQLNQWLALFDRLSERFIIMVRELHHYSNMEHINIPILFINNTLGVERIASIRSIKGALYTTNVGKNIHLIRNNNIKHIFIGHGDSDKSGSANNIMKMYDHMFVAGEAHIDRINKNNISVPNNYFFKIGRPQLQSIQNQSNDVIIKRNNKLRILYAPTWEGYYKDSSYSSLKYIHSIVSELFNNNKVEFNFKAHPLTGTIDKDFLNISKRMSAESMFMYDSLYKYFNNIDILISDISSVISDALYFNIPTILYKPDFIEDIEKEVPISKCTYVIDSTTTNLIDRMNQIKNNDYLSKERKKMIDYVMGDNTSSIKRFTSALETFIKD